MDKLTKYRRLIREILEKHSQNNETILFPILPIWHLPLRLYSLYLAVFSFFLPMPIQ